MKLMFSRYNLFYNTVLIKYVKPQSHVADQHGSELAWRSGSVMDCHATTRGSIPGRNGVKTELHVLRKGQQIGASSLNDLAVDGTLNTTN